ncbi:hypothetical protein HN51_006144 [Arachis hypogaea]|nr:uncharacterized protein DS421_4g134200 [Arachis hypogaea]
MITKTKGKKGSSSTAHIPLFNSNNVSSNFLDTDNSVLSLLQFLSMAFCCGSTIYSSWIKRDFQMLTFVTFVYFVLFMSYFWSWVYQRLPPSSEEHPKNHRRLNFVMWVLESVIMFGFSYAFSKFMGMAASICIFVIFIVARTLILYASLYN